MNAPASQIGRSAEPVPAAGPFLLMDNVSRHFGTLRAVDGVTFEMNEGELRAVIGEPLPRVAAKDRPALDPAHRRWLAASPFCLVATSDAVLVTSRGRGGEVKGLVEQLRAKGEPEADAHRLMYRPWGNYQRIDIGSRFQVKRITVKPGARLSLQKHFHRAEHWVVVHGTAEVTVDDKVTLVHENEAIYLPIGCVHRLSNPGKIPLELIEVQVGSYTGEDDIIRIEDVYGR